MRAVFDSCVKQDNIEPGSFLLGTFRAIESDATETPFPSGLAQTPEETCEARDLLLRSQDHTLYVGCWMNIHSRSITPS